MPRLVLVLPYYNPPYIGGAEIRARERAERLADSGWSVLVLTSAQGTHPHTAASGGVMVRYLRSRELAHTPVIFGLALELLRVPRDSVIQVDTAQAYCPEVTALVCMLRRMPFITRVPVDTEAHSGVRQLILSAYQRTILRLVYKKAARVIVLTSDDIEHLASKYRVDPDKVRVAPNASDFARVKAQRMGFDEPFRLLFVGRLNRQKNVPLLLESLRYFNDTYSLPVRLNIVGNGEEMGMVRQMIADFGLAGQVSLPGYVTGPDLERVYENADAFVLTSTTEGFGQVLLEAMAKGLPVIASDIRCVRTVVTDGSSGLLVSRTKKDVAAAIYRLIRDDGLYAKLSAGALATSKNYNWEATLQRYTAVYDEVAAR